MQQEKKNCTWKSSHDTSGRCGPHISEAVKSQEQWNQGRQNASKRVWPRSYCYAKSSKSMAGVFPFSKKGKGAEDNNDKNISEYDLWLNVDTPSIPNCKSFDFFYPKFDHSFYSKNLCKYSQILSHSWRTFINKPIHNKKKSNILYKTLNKTSGQTWY